MGKKAEPNLRMNYIYNLLYQILTVIGPLITSPYISRVLGSENIGIYSFINANAGYFILIGVFGLSTYSQFEVARRRDNEKELRQFCVESLLTRFCTMGISLVLYSIIYLCGNSEYKLFYIIQSFTLLANALDFTWICQGLEDFKIITIRNFIVKLLSILFVFIFIKTSDDLFWYFIINSLSVLVGNISIFPHVKKCLYLKKLDRIRIIPHIKAAIIYFLPSTASTIIYSADKLMIGWFSIDKTQNGYYEQAMKIETIIFMLFAALNITMRPRMAYLFKHNMVEQIKKYMQQSVSIVLFFALPISVGLIQIAEIFVPWFFGEGYDGVVSLLRIMSGWILIKAVSNCLLEQSIVAKGKMVLATKIIWVGAFANIPLNILLIPRYSANGAATASLITELIILVYTMLQTYTELDFLMILRNVWKELVAVFIMGGSLVLVKKLFDTGGVCTLVMILVGMVIYFGATFVLKDDMLNEFLKIAKEKIKMMGKTV